MNICSVPGFTHEALTSQASGSRTRTSRISDPSRKARLKGNELPIGEGVQAEATDPRWGVWLGKDRYTDEGWARC